MNERYAAEPTGCDSAFELKHLLEKFGPTTGRYLGKYPSRAWETLLRGHVARWKDIEQAKAMTLLRRANEAHALVRTAGIPYEERETWVQNVTRVQRSLNRFDGVVVSRPNCGPFPSIEDFELPPTAAEPVAAKAAQYVRASSTLLVASPELHFIDAYLDPADRDKRVVLVEMLRAAKSGRCQSAHLWVRADRLKRSKDETAVTIRAIAGEAGFTSPRTVYLHAFVDACRSVKVHDRYLLSLYGAIRFEHGFQELSGKRTASVSPESAASHLQLVRVFMEGHHDLECEMTPVQA